MTTNLVTDTAMSRIPDNHTQVPAGMDPAAAAPSWRSEFTAVLRHEWKPLRRLHGWFGIIWLLGLWIVPVIDHPGWLLFIGLAYVWAVVPSLAGSDVLDGTEEFSFSLPPGRGMLYAARLLIVLLALLLLTAVGGLAIALDLPPRLWSLVMDSGLAEPFPPVETRFMYGLAVVLPLSAAAIAFVLAALAGSRTRVGQSALIAVVAVGLLALGAFYLDHLLWGEPRGWICLSMHGVLALALPAAGWRAFLRKEAVIGAGGRSAGGWLPWVILGLVLLVVVLLLSFVSYQQAAGPPSRPVPQSPASP